LTLGLPAAGCRDSTGGVEPAAGNALSLRASSSAAADLPAPDPRPVLACFGDSLTAGYGTEPGESYPDFLQRRLDAAGFHYRVVNLGISGDTTKDGLDRIARVLSRHPNIVVLEFGGNDGLRGLPLEQTQANLAAMIERLQAAGAQVALAGITLPPDYGKDYITRLDAIYPTLARRYHLRLLPFLLQGVYGVPGDMQSDATHATAQGNQQVALNVQRLIEPLLRHESRPPRP
jgi:acyl-CoA thioesterase-1